MMKVALAFFIVFCATLLIPLSHCYPGEFTNVIPISRRSSQSKRGLAGDFDVSVAVSRVYLLPFCTLKS